MSTGSTSLYITHNEKQLKSGTRHPPLAPARLLSPFISTIFGQESQIAVRINAEDARNLFDRHSAEVSSIHGCPNPAADLGGSCEE